MVVVLTNFWDTDERRRPLVRVGSGHRPVTRGWHVLRHTFGTHAALFGANPWVLMDWMGHKRIDEKMLYVHFAGAHARPTPVQATISSVLDAIGYAALR